MNLIRSILSASLLVAYSTLTSLPTSADAPVLVPTRPAGGQLESEDTLFDHLFQSDSSHVQFVADEIQFNDEDDSLELADEATQSGHESADSDLDENGADQDESDQASPDDEQKTEDEDRQRSDRIIAGIGALKKPVSEIVIRAKANGEVPENRAARFSQYGPVISIGALGIASADPDRYTICFTHRPLYYEQRNLERCGQGCRCLQNAVSGAQFLLNTALLPYHIGRQPCNSLVTSGGDCKTCQSYPIDCDLLPIDRHGLMPQAAALAGFTFLLL